jgi:hypothetical protein
MRGDDCGHALLAFAGIAQSLEGTDPFGGFLPFGFGISLWQQVASSCDRGRWAMFLGGFVGELE